MKLGICHDMKPFIGALYPAPGVITSKTNSPNASKLFIHYLMTAEGIKLQGVDGKMSSNQKVALPAEEASGIQQYRNQLMMYKTATSNSRLAKASGLDGSLEPELPALICIQNYV